MTRAVVALCFLFALDARADERTADLLRAFVVDTCEYLAENHPTTAEEAQPHFGKLRKREWVTKQVSTPHPRYYVDAKRLPGWQVSLEYSLHINVTVPRNLRVTVAELEKVVGPVENEDVSEAPEHFSIVDLGPKKTCMVIIQGDGKSGRDDWRRQRVVSITVED